MSRRRDDFFAGKLIVITGGTSGIGLALARELRGLQARTILLSDKAASVSNAVREMGGESEAVVGYVCDIGSPQSVAAICATVSAKHGAPDILINNAGFAIYRTFEQEEPSEVERLISVNFAGAIRVTKAFLGGMVERRSGHIVNIASIAATLPLTPNAIYGGAKHGMLGWSRCLVPELARFGIDVTVICPGRVETNFFNHPSFRARRHRKETDITVPMETVVRATLDAILRRQRVRHVPAYYGILGWGYSALGPFVRGPLDRLSRSRVEDLYRHE